MSERPPRTPPALTPTPPALGPEAVAGLLTPPTPALPREDMLPSPSSPPEPASSPCPSNHLLAPSSSSSPSVSDGMRPRLNARDTEAETGRAKGRVVTEGAATGAEEKGAADVAGAPLWATFPLLRARGAASRTATPAPVWLRRVLRPPPSPSPTPPSTSALHALKFATLALSKLLPSVSLTDPPPSRPDRFRRREAARPPAITVASSPCVRELLDPTATAGRLVVLPPRPLSAAAHSPHPRVPARLIVEPCADTLPAKLPDPNVLAV